MSGWFNISIKSVIACISSTSMEFLNEGLTGFIQDEKLSLRWTDPDIPVFHEGAGGKRRFNLAVINWNDTWFWGSSFISLLNSEPRQPQSDRSRRRGTACLLESSLLHRWGNTWTVTVQMSHTRIGVFLSHRIALRWDRWSEDVLSWPYSRTDSQKKIIIKPMLFISQCITLAIHCWASVPNYPNHETQGAGANPSMQ